MTEHDTATEHFHHEAAPGQGENGDNGAPGEVTAQSVAQHLSSLLLSAEGAAQRIIEEAEAKVRDQLAEADRRTRWMEAEATRMASWGRQTEEMIRALSAAVGDFRKDVEAVPQRISEALTPLASHVPVLIGQMEELTSALRPPPSEEGSPDGPAEAPWKAGWHDLEHGVP
jgi:hypothetical protein